MNGDRTSLIRHENNFVQYAIAILIGYGIGGFCLSSCQTTLFVWIIIDLLIGYTAFTGQGGIALSSLCFSSVLTIYTLAKPWPLIEKAFLPLDSAQLWAFALLSMWMLGVLLLCLLGFAGKNFARQRWPKWQYATYLSCLSWFSLALGHRIFGYLVS